ncbi:unnamed protein product [Urochloa decumbens]|uniref:Uncharacterized protein n=1 Tax=Urochloa decumbens TaxID=240449 RepID=A0ABC9D1L8_9POAL
MAPPISRKVSSLEEVTELIGDHGEVQGVRVHMQRKIESICEGKEMAVLLRVMVGRKGWEVPQIETLAKLVPIHDNLFAADSIIDDLIRRTHPTTTRTHRCRRQAGVHVGSPIRVPALDAASGRRLNDRASSPPPPRAVAARTAPDPPPPPRAVAARTAPDPPPPRPATPSLAAAPPRRHRSPSASPRSCAARASYSGGHACTWCKGSAKTWSRLHPS